MQDVNKLLKQFDDMSTMMKKMKKLGQKGLMRHGIGALHAQVDAESAAFLSFWTHFTEGKA